MWQMPENSFNTAPVRAIFFLEGLDVAPWTFEERGGEVQQNRPISEVVFSPKIIIFWLVPFFGWFNLFFGWFTPFFGWFTLQ